MDNKRSEYRLPKVILSTLIITLLFMTARLLAVSIAPPPPAPVCQTYATLSAMPQAMQDKYVSLINRLDDLLNGYKNVTNQLNGYLQDVNGLLAIDPTIEAIVDCCPQVTAAQKTQFNAAIAKLNDAKHTIETDLFYLNNDQPHIQKVFDMLRTGWPANSKCPEQDLKDAEDTYNTFNTNLQKYLTWPAQIQTLVSDAAASYQAIIGVLNGIDASCIPPGCS